MRTLLATFALALAALVVGCRKEAAPEPVSQGMAPDIGLPCATNDGCTRGLCVRVDDRGGICTSTCDADDACPAAVNWRCLATDSLDAAVCACRKLAAHEICDNGADDDCNGLVDDCLECAGERFPPDDAAHCGDCDVACGAGEVCSRGACQCAAGTSRCGAACVDLQTDAEHCGACGVACPAGEACSGGACACAGESAPDWCAGEGCVSLATDAASCGACGHACPAGATCVDGACACPASQRDCGGACVDVAGSASHCGDCDTTCLSGQSCVNGACKCATGRSVCGTQCVDLRSDASHCGTCGAACGANEQCSAGACTCPSGLRCQGVCVASSDVDNCGACGAACGVGQVCSGGACACPGGQTRCATTCVDAKTDPANCGGCGQACAPGEVCSNGACKCASSGQTYCEAALGCVSLVTDAQNCGACGNACPPALTCVASSCVCPASGQTWCPQQGGCVALSTDAKNCGACGVACLPGQTCAAGQCACPQAGQAWCPLAGTCIDTRSDAKNCGACGVECPAGTHCANGSCACDQSSLSLCADACVDLATDAAHCGSCTIACPGTATCSSRACKCPAPTLGAEVLLAPTTATAPALAWDGVHAGLTYLQTALVAGVSVTNVMFALLNPDGTRAMATDLALTSFATSAYGPTGTPSLAWSGSAYLAAWVEHPSSGTYRVAVQRISSNGVPLGGAIDVTAITAATKLPTDSDVHVAWSSSAGSWLLVAANTVSSSPFVWDQLLAADASSAGAARAIALPTYGYDVVPSAVATAPDGHFGVIAAPNSSVVMLELGTDGALVGSVATVDSYADPLSTVDIAHDGVGWVGAWRARGSSYSVLVSRGTTYGNTVRVGNTTPYAATSTPFPALRLARSGSAITLAYGVQSATGGPSDVEIARLWGPDAATSPASVLAGPLAVQASAYEPAGAAHAVADTGAGVLVVWPDARSGKAALYARAIDTKGCP